MCGDFSLKCVADTRMGKGKGKEVIGRACEVLRESVECERRVNQNFKYLSRENKYSCKPSTKC